MGVERPGRDSRQAQRAQPLDHLGRGLVGERDDEDLVSRHDLGRDRVRRPPADDPGLAAPGTGVDHYRAGSRLDGLELVGVEVGEERGGIELTGHGPRVRAIGYAPVNPRRRARTSSRWVMRANDRDP